MKRSSTLIVIIMLLFVLAVPASAQKGLGNTASITLYVKTEFGERLKIPPLVRVIPISSGMPMPYTPIFTGDGGIIFSNLVPGEDYELTIKADGYQVTTE